MERDGIGERAKRGREPVLRPPAFTLVRSGKRLPTPLRSSSRRIMGLTVHYDWKIKTDMPSARRLIAKFRAIALKLPFDEVSEIREQDSPDGNCAFQPHDH